MFENSKANIPFIKEALQLLQDVIKRRLDQYIQDKPFMLPVIDIDDASDPLMLLLKPCSPGIEEYLLLAAALAPHVQPDFFDRIIREAMPEGGDFPEFGGVRGSNHRGILPTGETAQFILAGDDLFKRIAIQEMLAENSFFFLQDILWLEQVKEGEPLMSGRLILSPELVMMLVSGQETKPKFGPEFPAKLVTTPMNWEDLVLHPYTADQIEDISRWLQYNDSLMDDPNLARKLKPGYRALFYGPAGTGKTFTASLLGKQFGKEVYRIDLSQIVSKYIGETEKNLGKVFDRAEHKNWILFFDEADALFGKRTSVQSSHDKYANQEVSFLLQRVEDFNGLMILASNIKGNLDEAFLRRFHAVIHFPMPNSQERLKLWTKAIPQSIPVESEDLLADLAQAYELSGASIINIVQYAALKALSQPGKKGAILTRTDLIEGVRKEFRKEDKSVL